MQPLPGAEQQLQDRLAELQKVSSLEACKGSTGAGQVHGTDEEENAKGKGKCQLLFPEAGR